MESRAFKSLVFVALLLTACGGQDDSSGKPSDGSWATPVELQRVPPLEGIGNGKHLERPAVAVDDQGNALVVWEEVAVARGFGFPQALWFSAFTPSGGWSTAARLEASSSPSGSTVSLEPRLAAVGGGSFVLAWQSGAHVFASRFDPGRGWGSRQDLGPGGGPALAANGTGAVVAAWYGSFDGAAETNGLLVSRLEREGFGAPLRVDTPQPIDNRPGEPSVAVDASGDATVVFERSQDLIAGRLRAGQLAPEGEVVLVSHAQANLAREAPAIGVDAAGRVFALWRQADAGTSGAQSLWSSRFTPGQGWSTPGPVDNALASVATFALGVSPGGDAFASWSLDPAGDVRAGRFTAGAWTASSTLLQDPQGRPVTGAAGPPSLGIDGSGSARVLFASASSVFENRFAPSEGWRGAEALPGAGRPRIAVAKSGEAMVVLAPADLRSISASRFVRSGL